MAENFEMILRFYTDWPLDRLLGAAAVTAALFLLLELTLALGIRRGSKPREGRRVLFPPWGLKILRVLLRFGLVILFLKAIQRLEAPGFPWNLAFRVPVLLLLFTGALTALFYAFSLLEKMKFADMPENSPALQLLSVSRRGLKITLFLILLSLLLWRILELFPGELRGSGPVTVVIIANGVLLITVLLLVVRRFFAAVEKLFSLKKGNTTLMILVDALSVPVRLLILALATVWMKTLVPESPAVLAALEKIIHVLVLAAVIVFSYRAVEALGARISRLSEEETNTLDKTLVEMVRMIARILFVIVGVFGIIRIFTGKPLTTLLAGLGIGGLAVALAAQDTLKNFFGSIMIMSDKPFKIGERVVVEGFDGVIEGIGFRSTRLRTLTGHQVVIPNDRMAQSAVENIGRRPTIRRLTNITVTYDTTPEMMDRALAIIRDLLENHEGMPEDFPPRVYFSEFNADSLNILVIYWYSPPDYWKFMAFSEGVNLRIMREFNREGIKFAFPSTTTYLEQPDGQSLRLEMQDGKWKSREE